MKFTGIKRIGLIQPLLLITLCTPMYAQKNLTGDYISNEQRHENDLDPSKNSHRFQNLEIEVNISDITNMGFLTVTFPNEDLSMKWDITRHLQKEYDEDKQTLYSAYEAYMNIENYRTDTQFTIVFIIDYSEPKKSIHLVIHGSEHSRTWYHNLKKIK